MTQMEIETSTQKEFEEDTPEIEFGNIIGREFQTEESVTTCNILPISRLIRDETNLTQEIEWGKETEDDSLNQDGEDGSQGVNPNLNTEEINRTIN